MDIFVQTSDFNINPTRTNTIGWKALMHFIFRVAVAYWCTPARIHAVVLHLPPFCGANRLLFFSINLI